MLRYDFLLTPNTSFLLFLLWACGSNFIFFSFVCNTWLNESISVRLNVERPLLLPLFSSIKAKIQIKLDRRNEPDEEKFFAQGHAFGKSQD